MFSKFFKKKLEKVDTHITNTSNYHYYMDTNKYRERTDDVYEYARIYPYNCDNCEIDVFFDFSYEFICKLAENHYFCYCVEYDENQHREVIEHLKANLDNGYVYSIIHSATKSLLCICHHKPNIDIMRKASKAGWNIPSGMYVYVHEDMTKSKKNWLNDAVCLFNIVSNYILYISVDEYDNMIRIKYDKSLITFDEIRKVAEEILIKNSGCLEVTI